MRPSVTAIAIYLHFCNTTPERCHASGAAVDAHRDTTAGVQRAERMADGGVVDISRALSGLPSASRINAQRVARFDPL